MTQNTLDIAEFLTVVERVRRECVANRVRGDIGNVSRLGMRLQDQPESLPREPTPAVVQKHSVLVGILTQQRSSGVEVRRQRFSCRAGQRYRPRSVGLTPATDFTLRQVDVSHVER